MRLGIKEIQEIIPHRHPFLLVDCIEELEPGKREALLCVLRFSSAGSSTNVFHSLQPGHCPIHFEDSYPQD